MKKTIKMREMLDNQKGVIKRVSATGDMGRRIREMGLVPETPIQIRGRAPLKDPVAVKIRDYVLTLRNNEADSVLVEVEEDPSQLKCRTDETEDPHSAFRKPQCGKNHRV